jgi:hypothetical protein
MAAMRGTGIRSGQETMPPGETCACPPLPSQRLLSEGRRSLDDFVRKEWTACLSRMRREERRGPERFAEASYQLMSDLVSQILDQISNLPSSPVVASTATAPALPPPLSPSRSALSSDRYEELIAENKRLSLRIKDFAASSHRVSARSDEEMVAVRVFALPFSLLSDPTLPRHAESL